MPSARFTPATVSSPYDATTINANFEGFAEAQENTLSRYADVPNSMQANLDMNGYAILNQLNPLALDAFEWMGPWVTATAYTGGQAVFYNSSAYVCIEDHTSGTFGADLAAAKWQIICQGTIDRGTWVGPGTYYFLGDIITDGSDLYKCIVNNESTASFANDLAAGWWELYTNFLGTMATQNANAVAITGGTVAGLTSLGATAGTITTLTSTTGNVTNLNSSNAAITGGAINGTTIGATTASSGSFTEVLLSAAISAANQATTKSYVDAAFSTGSIALPGGLILKYGTSTVASGSIIGSGTSGVYFMTTPATGVTFSSAFPSNNFYTGVIIQQWCHTGGAWCTGQYVSAKSSTGFTYYANGLPTAATGTADQDMIVTWWSLGN